MGALFWHAQRATDSARPCSLTCCYGLQVTDSQVLLCSLSSVAGNISLLTYHKLCFHIVHKSCYMQNEGDSSISLGLHLDFPAMGFNSARSLKVNECMSWWLNKRKWLCKPDSPHCQWHFHSRGIFFTFGSFGWCSNNMYFYFFLVNTWSLARLHFVKIIQREKTINL